MSIIDWWMNTANIIPVIGGGDTTYDYYFSTSGNDSNTGTSDSSPWQTISKLNTQIALGTFNNKTVAFKKGDIWEATNIIITNQSNITFTSYGTGNMPIFTGLQTVVGTWASYSGNIWTYRNTSLTSNVRKLFIDSSEKIIGRWPNAGSYRVYNGAVGHASFNDAVGLGVENGYWNGAEAVTRTTQYGYTMDVIRVTSQASNTFNVTATVGNYGFFNTNSYYLQNHVNCLDTEGDWAFDQTGLFGSAQSNTFYLYSTTNPNTLTVQTSVVDKVVDISGSNNIIFDGIQVQAGNLITIEVDNATGFQFKNGQIDYSGFNGIVLTSSNTFLISNSTLEKIGNLGIWERSCSNYIITDCNLNNIGVDRGLGEGGGVRRNAILLQGGDNGLVDYCNITYVGYNGISLLNGAYGGYTACTNTTIKRTFLDYTCYVACDGGGVYVVGDGANNNKIQNCISLHNDNPTALEMLANPDTAGSNFYLDDLASYFLIENCIAAYGFYLYYLHSGDNITLNNNIGYKGVYATLAIVDSGAANEMTNLTLDSNCLVNGPGTFYSMYMNQISGEINGGTVTFNNEYYIDPFKARTANIMYGYNSITPDYNTFAQWEAQTYTTNVHGCPLLYSERTSTCTQDQFVQLIYNATKIATVNNLGSGTWRDKDNQTVASPVTLQPYTGMVLFKYAD